MAATVALIYPRFKYPSGDFSLGLAYIGAYLNKHLPDVDVTLIDTTHHPSLGYLRNRLAASKPDVAAIYADTMMFEDAVKVAFACKEHGIRVILGGPHPTIAPEQTLSVSAVDAVCIGEGERTAKEYVACVLEDGNLENVKGIWFKRNGDVIRNPPRPYIEDLDDLPFPAVGLYETERYIKGFVQLESYRPNMRGMSIIASRGCPFRCGHCQPTLSLLFGPRARIRSPRNVVDEILHLKARYRLEAFYFQDDTLTVFKGWIREFCTLLIEEQVGMTWACNTRADTCDGELLALMSRAGLVKVKVGIESVTDRIRNGMYNKNVSLRQVDLLIREARSIGVQVAGFFMLGAPTETVEEINDTIRYAVRSDLVEANFSITTALPRTGLWDASREQGWKLPERLDEYDYYRARRPSAARGEVSPARLEQLRRKAILMFYLHPKRIRRTLAMPLGRAGVARLMVKLKRW
jgi:radical SAM superfamily enzyme YgiQ (UPF0313 family)